MRDCSSLSSLDLPTIPHFYRGGRWSKVGKTTVEELDRGLTGIFHDRYFKGLRRAPEGMVFDLQDSDIIDELPVDIDRWIKYNAMDFGMSAPSVCLMDSGIPTITGGRRLSGVETYSTNLYRHG